MQWVANYSTWIYILLVILSAGLAYWTYWYQNRRVFSIPQRLTLTALRFLEFLLLGFLLFSPLLLVQTDKNIKPKLLVAMDHSKSVGKNLSKAQCESLGQDIYKGIELLSEDYDIDTISFGEQIGEELLGDLEQTHTDMGQLSSYISERYYEQPLKEILLLTDGYNNRGPQPFGANYLLSTPISVVAIGDTVSIPDFAINVLYTPQSVLVKNDIIVNLEASCKNSLSRRAELSISVNGTVIKKEQLVFGFQDEILSRQLSIPTEKVGVHNICVTISSSEKEYNLSNNTKCSSVKVTDERLAVAYCYESVHPDVAAVTRALKGQQNIVLKKYKGVPASIQEDIVIAHNLSDPASISRIIQSGRPYWLISGLRSNTSAWTTDPVIKNENARSREITARFNPSFSYFDKTFIDEGVLASLPPLVRNQSSPRFSSSAQSLFTSGDNIPLYSFMSGKRPRVITAGEGLWRWRMADYRTRKNTKMFDALIQQSLIFLQQSQRKNDFTIRMSRTTIPLGEPAVWNAQFYNQNMELDNRPTITLNIAGQGIRRQLDLNKTKDAYTLIVDDFPSGEYKYTATLKTKGLSKSLSGSFEVQNIDIEAPIPYANMPLINQVVHKWDGSVYTLSTLQTWFEKMDQKEYPQSIVKESSWQDAIDLRSLAVALVLLLIAEWTLRKLWGSI